jgi:hypothetical protein
LYRFELYFRRNTSYEAGLNAIRDKVRAISVKWKTEFEEIDVDKLSVEEMCQLIGDIRSIPPQVRGRIVSSRGKVLPLSGSKLLNVANTPILVLRQNSTAISVFPHLLGATYFDIESSLDRILNQGPSEYFQDRGLLENPIVKILADNPALLEEGMRFIGSGVEVPAGVVDVLLQDREGTDVLVEVETRARDSAVGQVLRLARSHAEKTGRNHVRKLIVCQDFDVGLPLACREAGIELFRLVFRRVCDA